MTVTPDPEVVQYFRDLRSALPNMSPPRRAWFIAELVKLTADYDAEARFALLDFVGGYCGHA